MTLLGVTRAVCRGPRLEPAPSAAGTATVPWEPGGRPRSMPTSDEMTNKESAHG
jgi:hypothetical protein